MHDHRTLAYRIVLTMSAMLTTYAAWDLSHGGSIEAPITVAAGFGLAVSVILTVVRASERRSRP